jgi:hypothetical protein
MMLWDQVTQYVAYEVPGAPAPLIEQHIRMAAITLCERSQMYQVDLDPINLVAGTSTYSLDSPDAQTDVCSIRYMWVNGVRVDPISADTLNGKATDWRLDTADYVKVFTQFDQESFVLYPSPATSLTGGILLKVALRPSILSTGMVDWIMKKYLQELATGAKASLAAMTGQTWSSPQLAAERSQEWETMLTLAEVEVNRGMSRTSMQIKMSPFA